MPLRKLELLRVVPRDHPDHSRVHAEQGIDDGAADRSGSPRYQNPLPSSPKGISGMPLFGDRVIHRSHHLSN